ncbi:hypothetical protein JCM4914_73570 [Streptomyces platensis subsp. malvinus]
MVVIAVMVSKSGRSAQPPAAPGGWNAAQGMPNQVPYPPAQQPGQGYPPAQQPGAQAYPPVIPPGQPPQNPGPYGAPPPQQPPYQGQ